MCNEAHFKEGAKQSTTLKEIDRVVSTGSFDMLVHWVCLGRIVFEESPSPHDANGPSIEFATLADMSNITGPKFLMADQKCSCAVPPAT